jgi:hypothetical protein
MSGILVNNSNTPLLIIKAIRETYKNTAPDLRGVYKEANEALGRKFGYPAK